jgi:hypothetical protein
MLPRRARIGVVHSNHYSSIRCAVLICERAAHGDIHQVVGWVGRRFDKNHRQPVFFSGGFDDLFEFLQRGMRAESAHFHPHLVRTWCTKWLVPP